jgi:tellurite resistance protein TerC
LRWSLLWFLLAMIVAAAVTWRGGSDDGLQFLTGYLVEYSLSLDNVFAMALIFAYFRVAPDQQHRVLFWGIFGALVMRGLMIGVGAGLLAQFHWFYYEAIDQNHSFFRRLFTRPLRLVVRHRLGGRPAMR